MAQRFYVGDLKVSSPAFKHHERIPDRHAGEDENLSPVLQWSGIPEDTKAFAVVVHDPDAPLLDGYTHWVAYGIPGDSTGLAEGGGDVIHGTNSRGEQAYFGPAPPPDHGGHHYYFWVYALDAELNLEPGLDRRALHERIEEHVIEQARLVGTYKR